MGLVTPLRAFAKRRIILPRYGDGVVNPSVNPIVVSGLAATPGLGEVILSWTLSDPSGVLAAVETHAANSNDRSLAAHYGDSVSPHTGFTHRVNPQGGSFFYWIRGRDRSGNVGPWFPTSPTGGVQSTANNIPAIPGQAYGLQNGNIVATSNGTALTIRLKTTLGNDPSPSDPVITSYRTQAGGYNPLAITVATSITISYGSNLGDFIGAPVPPFEVWVVLFETGVLGVINPQTAAGPFQLTEVGLRSAVAEGGAGGADSAGVIYATATVTNKALRIIGVLRWNNWSPYNIDGSLNGKWLYNPDSLQLLGPAISPPGQGIDNSPWLSYIATITSETGAFTTVSAAGRYKIIGKTCFIYIEATITANGTAAGWISISLPVNGRNISVGPLVGLRNIPPGSLLLVYVSGAPATTLLLKNYDATYAGGNGVTLSIAGQYEIA